MAEENPYETPKTAFSDVENNHALAYRDGGQLIARAGFVGPKICVATGKPVADGVKPMKVVMKTTSSWENVFNFRFLLLIVSNSMIIPVFKWLDSNIWLMVLYVAWLFLVGRIFQSGFRSIEVYCHEELTRSLRRRQWMNHVFTYAGLFLLFYVVLANFSLLPLVVGVLCFICGMFTLPKKLLNSVGVNGKEEKFEGAHYLFLDTLPTMEETELELLS